MLCLKTELIGRDVEGCGAYLLVAHDAPEKWTGRGSTFRGRKVQENVEGKRQGNQRMISILQVFSIHKNTIYCFRAHEYAVKTQRHTYAQATSAKFWGAVTCVGGGQRDGIASPRRLRGGSVVLSCFFAPSCRQVPLKIPKFQNQLEIKRADMKEIYRNKSKFSHEKRRCFCKQEEEIFIDL